MASKETIRQVFGVVLGKFPDRIPKTPDENERFALMRDLWVQVYSEIPDADLMRAAARWMAETEKLWPSDCPFAAIRRMALPEKYRSVSYGDAQQLLDEAVRRFGYMREDEAMAWIRSKSELVASAVLRIGFLEYCRCEQPDVIRGQFRHVFETEAKRAEQIGHIVPSATMLRDDRAPTKAEIGERIGGIAAGILEDLRKAS